MRVRRHPTTGVGGTRICSDRQRRAALFPLLLLLLLGVRRDHPLRLLLDQPALLRRLQRLGGGFFGLAGGFLDLLEAVVEVPLVRFDDSGRDYLLRRRGGHGWRRSLGPAPPATVGGGGGRQGAPE